MSNKNTFKEVVLINAFLCLSVVMIHITSNPVNTLLYGSVWHIIIFSINKFLTFSVPIFIFLSGFKLYGKYYQKNVNIKNFYWGRFKKIVIPYIACVLIYFIYFYTKHWVSARDLPKYLFLGTLSAHFYYIVIAVQLYIIFPSLKVLFEKAPKTVTVISLICTILCLEFSGFNYSDRFMGTYIFYFVFGMLFSKYKLYEKIQKMRILYIAGFIVTAVVHIYLSYLATGGKFFYRFGYAINMLYVVLSILALYCIFYALRNCKILYKSLGTVSNVSFSIYLYHIMIINLLQYDIYPHFSLSPRETFIITFTVVYSTVFIYSFLNSKIPKPRNSLKKTNNQ